MAIYLSDEIKKELIPFKRLHEHFSLSAGKKNISVKDADEKILYMMMSASYAMDIFEEGFFENFVITDKQITGKSEIQIDAYAFIETEKTNERHLHIFQFKLHESPNNSASPVEVNTFASLMNDIFVHPDLRLGVELDNPVFKEISDVVQKFIPLRRNNKIKVKCHFINNAKGVTAGTQKTFDELFQKFESDKQQNGFGIQVYGEKEILELIQEGKIRVDKEVIQFTLDAKQFSYRLEDNSKKDGLGLPDKVFVGIANVNELIRLQDKFHHNQLYNENIRLYLGDRVSVNKDIIRTITSIESQWFQYMNNGISIICDKMEIGSINEKKQTLSIELSNLQIINGCQTVNALYSAKYNDETKDKFNNSSNILIKIYQINPTLPRFKQNVIKATNNQNAVKTSALYSNDPIQIEIQDALKRIGYLYDRKEEAKKQPDETKVVSMVQAALSYRAVFEFGGQKLRSRIGQTRVFEKNEYDRIYKEEYVGNKDEINKLSSQLLTSTIIMDTIRELIKENEDKYLGKLPVFKKSTYYLAGLYYGKYKSECDTFLNNCVKLIEEDHLQKAKKIPIFSDFITQIKKNFTSLMRSYKKFYDGLTLDKVDIDNLLKMEKFGKAFNEFIEKEFTIKKEG